MVRLKFQPRALPHELCVDNGPKTAPKTLHYHAYVSDFALDASRPSKPNGNASVKPLNVRLGDERLNTHWIFSSNNARGKIEAWLRHIYEDRPLTTLGHLIPAEFALSARVNHGRRSAVTHMTSNTVFAMGPGAPTLSFRSMQFSVQSRLETYSLVQYGYTLWEHVKIEQRKSELARNAARPTSGAPYSGFSIRSGRSSA